MSPQGFGCVSGESGAIGVTAPLEMVGCFSSNGGLKFKCQPLRLPASSLASVTDAGATGRKRLPMLIKFSYIPFQPKPESSQAGARAQRRGNVVLPTRF